MDIQVQVVLYDAIRYALYHDLRDKQQERAKAALDISIRQINEEPLDIDGDFTGRRYALV